jgi:hypothetical protein
MFVRFISLATLVVFLPCLAHADEADKNGYTLFNPVPDNLMRKFAPDRPTKGFSVRTVDAGHIEIETDLINSTYSNYLGVTHSLQTLDPTVKIGVTKWMDVEVQFNGLQYMDSLTAGALPNFQSNAGLGDVVLRSKIKLFGNDSGPAI